MPVKFDLATDELYLEGIEKGIEQQRHESVLNLLKLGKLTVEEIALVSAVSVEYVKKVQREFSKKSRRSN